MADLENIEIENTAFANSTLHVISGTLNGIKANTIYSSDGSKVAMKVDTDGNIDLSNTGKIDEKGAAVHRSLTSSLIMMAYVKSTGTI